MVLIRRTQIAIQTQFSAGSRRRISALAGSVYALGERLVFWVAQLVSLDHEFVIGGERVAPAHDNSTSDPNGRVFMSPFAVDRARPLIQGQLIPYLYELIHIRASCLVSHFRRLPAKLCGTVPVHESAFAVPSRRGRVV